MEIREKNAKDVLEKIKELEKDHTLTALQFQYEKEIIPLSFKELQTIQYLHEIEEFRFQAQSVFRYRRVLEFCPYGSWGRTVFQEVNERLIPIGLIEIIVENNQDAYSLTQKARSGLYNAVLMKKEKKYEENKERIEFLRSKIF